MARQAPPALDHFHEPVHPFVEMRDQAADHEMDALAREGDGFDAILGLQPRIETAVDAVLRIVDEPRKRRRSRHGLDDQPAR